MLTEGKITTLYEDKEKTQALFPRTKINAVSDDNGKGLEIILETIDAKTLNSKAESQLSVNYANSAGNADTLGGYTKQDIINLLHPIGSWWFSDDPTSPAELFGIGSWERLDQTGLGKHGLIAAIEGDSAYGVGLHGGEETHQLTEAELPNISGWVETPTAGARYGMIKRATGPFSVETAEPNLMSPYRGYDPPKPGYRYLNINFGSNQPHNNMSPYYATYIWHRVA